VLVFLRVRPPVESGIAVWAYRQTSQDVCPWNYRFARELPDDSPYAPRQALAGKDARTLARDLLGMTQAEFSAVFRGSPMKRAKLRGLKRNAAVVLGNPSTGSGQAALAEDVDVLTRALDDDEPLPSLRSGQAVRAHASWALFRLGEDDPSAR